MINAKQLSLTSQTLANLHGFRCAARHLSFTLAAEELHLTQGAISQQIKRLENQLGFALFLRFNRRLQLTAEGEQLLAEVNRSLGSLEMTIRDLRSADLSGELRLSVPPSWALAWLSRQLPSFQKLYPQLRLKLETHNRLIDFYSEPVDMALYYGQPDYPGLNSWLVADEYLTPVCAPDYLTGQQQNHQPLQLQQCTLLHDASAWPQAGSYAEWSFWAENRTEALTVDRGHCFDMSELAIQSAINGVGIALGRQRLVSHYLQKGWLIEPFGPEARLKAPQSYYLVCHPDRSKHPAISAFRDWLCTQLSD